MATNYMNLELPVVTETLGPLWATELNEALETVDLHDHTSGKGKPVPTSGIDINANLDFNEYKAYSLLSTQYEDQSATLTGASNAGSVYVKSGNLYYTNTSGTAVQLTSGGSIVTSPGTVQSLEYTFIDGDLTIDPSDTFVTVAVDTGAERTVTLPLAAAVAAGRVYIIKDVTGEALDNPLTVDCQGSDTIDEAASLTMDSGFGAVFVTSNGVDNWAIL